MDSAIERTHGTVPLTRFRGSPFLWAFPFLLIMFGLLELLTRQPEFQDRLSFPRMGSRHSQIGMKYTRLLALQRETGGIDCIAVGSSTVDQAFDPVVFAEAYQAETGSPIRCFNFAIDAMAPSATSILAAILVEDFRPHMLIIGTDARDLTIPKDDPDLTVVTETPWIRYRGGEFDLAGWLMEHSYTYRYAWHINQLLRGWYAGVQREPETASVALGQTPQQTVDRTVLLPRYPQPDEYLAAYYRAHLQNFRVLPENVEGLRSMLAMNSSQTRVILVEMPVSPSYFGFFRNPEKDYGAFIKAGQQLAGEYGVPFWKTTELNLIPDNGWFDFGHVNVTGAHAFSTWLGHKVASLEQE